MLRIHPADLAVCVPVADEIADELLSAHWDDLVFPGEENEMDAPSDWDAGTITFDPYV